MTEFKNQEPTQIHNTTKQQEQEQREQDPVPIGLLQVSGLQEDEELQEVFETHAENDPLLQSHYYHPSHPLLNLPPFQPQIQPSFEPPPPPPTHQQQQSQSQQQNSLHYFQPYRSFSLPHIMPSYHLIPQYFIPSVPAPIPALPPPSTHYQSTELTSSNITKSEPVSSVFKKTCYKCGNLGHYAEECEFDERLCYNCKKPGHETSDCPLPRSTDLKQCYICRKIGHLQSNCPTKLSNESSISSSSAAGSQQQQQQQQQYFIQRPAHPPSIYSYYYPNYEPLDIGSNKSSLYGTGNSFSSEPSSPHPHQQQQQQQFDFQQPIATPSQQVRVFFNPNFINQRTLYLQTANHAFHQRQYRAGSAPILNTNYANNSNINTKSKNRGGSGSSGSSDFKFRKQPPQQQQAQKGQVNIQLNYKDDPMD